MSKPLTIEQLKALEVGDWVWITDEKSNGGCYARKESALYGEEETEFCFETIEVYDTWFYDNYGKTWLAYKNKEEAESKYDSRVEQAKKQTAKEILQNMLNKMYMLTGCGVPYHVKKFISEIAKEYGVEVEE